MDASPTASPSAAPIPAATAATALIDVTLNLVFSFLSITDFPQVAAVCRQWNVISANAESTWTKALVRACHAPLHALDEAVVQLRPDASTKQPDFTLLEQQEAQRLARVEEAMEHAEKDPDPLLWTMTPRRVSSSSSSGRVFSIEPSERLIYAHMMAHNVREWRSTFLAKTCYGLSHWRLGAFATQLANSVGGPFDFSAFLQVDEVDSPMFYRYFLPAMGDTVRHHSTLPQPRVFAAHMRRKRKRQIQEAAKAAEHTLPPEAPAAAADGAGGEPAIRMQTLGRNHIVEYRRTVPIAPYGLQALHATLEIGNAEGLDLYAIVDGARCPEIYARMCATNVTAVSLFRPLLLYETAEEAPWMVRIQPYCRFTNWLFSSFFGANCFVVVGVHPQDANEKRSPVQTDPGDADDLATETLGPVSSASSVESATSNETNNWIRNSGLQAPRRVKRGSGVALNAAVVRALEVQHMVDGGGGGGGGGGQGPSRGPTPVSTISNWDRARWEDAKRRFMPRTRPCSWARLRSHLMRLLVAQMPSHTHRDSHLFIRFYVPDVLRVLLATSARAQSRALFGGGLIQLFLRETRSGEMDSFITCRYVDDKAKERDGLRKKKSGKGVPLAAEKLSDAAVPDDALSDRAPIFTRSLYFLKTGKEIPMLPEPGSRGARHYPPTRDSVPEDDSAIHNATGIPYFMNVDRNLQTREDLMQRLETEGERAISGMVQGFIRRHSSGLAVTDSSTAEVTRRHSSGGVNRSLLRVPSLPLPLSQWQARCFSNEARRLFVRRCYLVLTARYPRRNFDFFLMAVEEGARLGIVGYREVYQWILLCCAFGLHFHKEQKWARRIIGVAWTSRPSLMLTSRHTSAAEASVSSRRHTALARSAAVAVAEEALADVPPPSGDDKEAPLLADAAATPSASDGARVGTGSLTEVAPVDPPNPPTKDPSEPPKLLDAKVVDHLHSYVLSRVFFRVRMCLCFGPPLLCFSCERTCCCLKLCPQVACCVGAKNGGGSCCCCMHGRGGSRDAHAGRGSVEAVRLPPNAEQMQ